jgi:WD40 repeat protein/tRNA A-37 threonylcarbamoyl transferase component Bud32
MSRAWELIVMETTILTDEEPKGLDEVIGAYYEAIDQGLAPDPIEWQNRFPDLARELAEFFEDQSRLRGIVTPLKQAVRGASSPPTDTGPAGLNLAAGSFSQGEPKRATPSSGLGDAGTLAGLVERLAGSGGDHPAGATSRRLGDYELIRLLGQGAMGSVYEARQARLNRLVAIKMIRAGAFATDAEVQRFQNEATAVAQLDHPRIVPIHEVGKIGDCHYFSMKLIRGGSLAHRLDAFRSNPRAAAGIVVEVARGIQHAHERGILHRDLKPGNILLDEHDQPQVTDFGLAKRSSDDSSLTQSGAILGTPSYMAPEQAAGRKGLITTLTDVYGLGAVLYALLTGHAPFVAETVIETIEQVRSRPPLPPTRLNPQVSRDLETICLKCLEKEPIRRYASAEALADDLQRWLDGQPIAARRVSARERAWMWCRRNPIVAGLLAASLLLAVGATWQWQRAEGLLLEAQYKESSAAVDQALELCEQGKVATGMLRLAKVLETAPRNADDLKRAVRGNIAAWSPYSPRLINVLPNPTGVEFVAFTRDGGTALTQSPERWARLWDAATGKPCGQPLRHQGAILDAVFNPDGQMVATAGEDGTARLWEVPSGWPLGEPFRHDGQVRCVAFSPDGRLLLTGTNFAGQLWDITSHKPLGKPFAAEGGVYAAAFLPDGRVAVIANVNMNGNGRSRLWDLKAGRSIGQPMDFHRLRDVGRLHVQATVLACSSDGKRILTNGAGRSAPYNAQLCDAATGEVIKKLQHNGPVEAVAFSGNGKVAITGSDDHTARIWDARTGESLSPALRHQNEVLAVALNYQGTIAATGSEDRTARLWDVVKGEALSDPLCHADQVRTVAIRSDSRAVLTGCRDHFARLWTFASPRQTGRPDPDEKLERLANVARAPHNRLVLMGRQDGTTLVQDAETRQQVGEPLRQAYAVLSVDWSPDGTMFVTGGVDGTVQTWSARTRLRVGRPMVHQGPVHSVAFSPDSRRVVSGSADRTARLSDSSTGRPIGPALDHDAAVTAVRFNVRGNDVLTRTEDGVVRRWAIVREANGPDERFILWAQVDTGSEIDSNDLVQGLGSPVWLNRRKRLQALGGRPSSGDVPEIHRVGIDE